jgi:CelD/BcsL family acetyltransferase involved in cellulose biosynthesis
MLAPRDIALTTEWRPLAGLGAIADEWRDLARRAAEPNVFYEPAFALATAPVLGPDAGAVLVRAVETRRLVGLFPCRIEARRYGIRLPLLAGWTHPYAPLGTPLVDRDAVVPALTAFLDHVADDEALPKLLLLNFLAEDGPVAAALDAVIARKGGRAVRFGAHRRALLGPGKDRDGYLDASLGRKRRKKLDRQRRQLDETGGVAFTVTADPAEVPGALADFFTLEARGWKGAAGTAAAQNAPIRRFMERATVALAAQGEAHVARLVHDGRTIAAAVVLRSGPGAWFWKIAYDEDVARASPGVQLTLDCTAAILRNPEIAWCDSCATPDHAMIDRIWRERRPISDQLIALEPGLRFAIACRLESLRRSALATARRIRDRVAR